ncbi:MAG: hypothetical protein VYC91_08570 [Acidobacteriota bacterium]|nr:hypothetical protein [Acidobacteriota bacterium]
MEPGSWNAAELNEVTLSEMWEVPQRADSGKPLKPDFLTPGRHEAAIGLA